MNSTSRDINDFLGEFDCVLKIFTLVRILADICVVYYKGEDKAHCLPVHSVQLGEVRVETSIEPAPVAGGAWHHLHGQCL